ncbi:MAG TPA: ATP-dependent chaperone ClpB, partial [Alphaproteobacteria bacterium]|nr:ATP-dependent chaperone ClpB [Alphaproteobacteria bacterium]
MRMQFEKYTERARSVIQAGQTLASRSGHGQYTPEHLLKVLLEDDSGMAANVIRKAGGRPEQVKQEAEKTLAKLASASGPGAGQLHLSHSLAKLFEQAEDLSKKAGDAYVTLERMLLALALS